MTSLTASQAKELALKSIDFAPIYEHVKSQAMLGLFETIYTLPIHVSSAPQIEVIKSFLSVNQWKVSETYIYDPQKKTFSVVLLIKWT